MSSYTLYASKTPNGGTLLTKHDTGDCVPVSVSFDATVLSFLADQSEQLSNRKSIDAALMDSVYLCEGEYDLTGFEFQAVEYGDREYAYFTDTEDDLYEHTCEKIESEGVTFVLDFEPEGGTNAEESDDFFFGSVLERFEKLCENGTPVTVKLTAKWPDGKNVQYIKKSF